MKKFHYLATSILWIPLLIAAYFTNVMVPRMALILCGMTVAIQFLISKRQDKWFVAALTAGVLSGLVAFGSAPLANWVVQKFFD